MMDGSRASPVLVVHLMGGLGNQMFQYALGRRLALANSAQLILDASGYASGGEPDRELGTRLCGLSHFRVSAKIVGSVASAVAGPMPYNRWIYKAHSAATRLAEFRKPYFLRQEIVEPDEQRFRFDKRLQGRRFDGVLTLRGFWQAEAYFLDIQDEIRAELRVHDEPRGKNAEMGARIEQTTSVAVHVRHGDNATSVAADLGLLPQTYYQKAIAEVRRNVPGPHFFVFSDSIEWARGLLGEDTGFIFVDHNEAASSHEDMRLMTLCRHHVLANSTFGWWGAWLGKKKGQIVYAPRRYYQNVDRPNPDFYPPSWRLIS